MDKEYNLGAKGLVRKDEASPSAGPLPASALILSAYQTLS
jgi:hypothetical protein